MRKVCKKISKVVVAAFVIAACLVKSDVPVFAEDMGDHPNYSVRAEREMNPWLALSTDEYTMSNINSGVKDTSVSLYKILQKIGIYGCIITSLIFLGMMAFNWNDPRAHSENKSKVINKFVVCFAICATSGILGVLIQVVKYAADY